MKKKFGYKAHRNIPDLEPQDVGEELDRIKADRETLTPQVVVDESRPKQAVLHNCFEWRDKVAGELYRVHQARNIINIVTITNVEEYETPRPHPQAFVNIVTKGGVDRESKYEDIRIVMQDPEQREKLLASCLRQLFHIRQKFRMLNELEILFREIDNAVQEMGIE